MDLQSAKAEEKSPFVCDRRKDDRRRRACLSCDKGRQISFCYEEGQGDNQKERAKGRLSDPDNGGGNEAVSESGTNDSDTDTEIEQKKQAAARQPVFLRIANRNKKRYTGKSLRERKGAQPNA